MDTSLEPWMRGYHVGVDPVLAAVMYALQQVREDVAKWTSGLDEQELWWTEGDIASVGWQVRHIAGSIDRLTTYADGRGLNDEQFAVLESEKTRGGSLESLLGQLEAALVRAEALLRTTSPAEFDSRRRIGRKEIPTTLAGLLVHVAEHSQRHVGELIVAAKLVRLRRSR